MRNLCVQIYAALLLAAITNTAVGQAQPAPQAPPIRVTPDNFNRAETDMNFAGGVGGQVGGFPHHREPVSIGFPIVRPNRDTLYSLSVFDLDAGPVTIALPNAGRRFMSMQVIDEDDYTPEVIYGAGSYTFTREKIGTRYVSLGVRILVNPADPEDIKQVHALQDAITVTQPGGQGRFEVPNWDQASQKKVRDALLALAETLPDSRRTFGARDQVDPVRHLIWNGVRLRWQSREGRPLSQRHPEQERRHDGPPADRQGRAGRRLLVDQRLQQRGPLSEEPIRRLHAQQHYREKGSRWCSRRSVRRVRRQISELPADHERVELHSAPLSPAGRNPERHMEIPGAAAGELRPEEASMSVVDILAWIVLVVLIAMVVAIFVLLGMLPGMIARRRGIHGPKRPRSAAGSP